MQEIDKILEERGTNYGEFSTQAMVAQNLKGILQQGYTVARHTALHREALEMIAHKIARIINGDPDYIDHWVDIEGYARLVRIELEERAKSVGQGPKIVFRDPIFYPGAL